ncbi:MAG: VPLPA-CTERM-specific exosortase XrtD [Gammaproteobacteria bacterium]|nr:VPLPA-CTERM-specific exosortase XrtD [Gammaproteobacteria bacterium]
MNTLIEETPILWRGSPAYWGFLAIASIILVVVFQTGIVNMYLSWGMEEYSHAYLLPFISGYFIWSKKYWLQRMTFNGSWAGMAIVLGGVLLYIFGELSSLYVIVQYSFVITLSGVVIAITSFQAARKIWPAFVLLLFMVPLPNYLQQLLSAKLQLLSSEMGVAVIRLFGISVYLEGNVIDLGVMKLQVVEACSGLRYLFPLMALGFIAAVLYREKTWKRLLIFFSTIPITVLMNSIRIGLVGVTVEYWGREAALGFLHDFEGWVVFMISTVVLMLEMWLLLKIGKQKRSLRQVFSLEAIPAPPPNSQVVTRNLPRTTVPLMALLLAGLTAALTLPHREEIQPPRLAFTQFPNPISAWVLRTSSIDKIYLDSLKLTDYYVGDYLTPSGADINLYMAYYASQRKGESVHSPTTCIPAGGWRIQTISTKTIKTADSTVPVNRAIVQQGENQQLVYYWFPQRGRRISNEYLAKWYIFQDSIMLNRTDGGLVRISTVINHTHPVEQAEAEMQELLRAIEPLITNYIPS